MKLSIATGANYKNLSDETKAKMAASKTYVDLTFRTTKNGSAFTISQEIFKNLGIDKNSITYANDAETGKAYVLVCAGNTGLSLKLSGKSEKGNKSKKFGSHALSNQLLEVGLLPEPAVSTTLDSGNVINEWAIGTKAFFKLTPLSSEEVAELGAEDFVGVYEITVDKDGVDDEDEVAADADTVEVDYEEEEEEGEEA